MTKEPTITSKNSSSSKKTKQVSSVGQTTETTNWNPEVFAEVDNELAEEAA